MEIVSQNSPDSTTENMTDNNHHGDITADSKYCIYIIQCTMYMYQDFLTLEKVLLYLLKQRKLIQDIG